MPTFHEGTAVSVVGDCNPCCTWDCVDGVCVARDDGSGAYTSRTACEAACTGTVDTTCSPTPVSRTLYLMVCNMAGVFGAGMAALNGKKLRVFTSVDITADRWDWDEDLEGRPFCPIAFGNTMWGVPIDAPTCDAANYGLISAYTQCSSGVPQVFIDVAVRTGGNPSFGDIADQAVLTVDSTSPFRAHATGIGASGWTFDAYISDDPASLTAC